MADIVDECVRDLMAKVQGVIPEGMAYVFSENDLSDLSGRVIEPPAVGVVYSGMSPLQAGSQHNRAQRMTFMVMVVSAGKGMSVKLKDTEGATNVTMTTCLDKLRQAIIDKTSPTGKVWSFGGEQAHDFPKCGIGYVQRWEVPATI